MCLCVRGDVCLAPSGCHQDRDLSPATKPTNEGTRFTAWAAPIASTTSFISPLLCGYNLLHYFFPPPLSFEFHTVYTHSHSHARTHTHSLALSFNLHEPFSMAANLSILRFQAQLISSKYAFLLNSFDDDDDNDDNNNDDNNDEDDGKRRRHGERKQTVTTATTL